MIQKMDFAVIGEQKIHCAGCEQRIGNALRRLRSIQDAQASVQTQRVIVSFDPGEVTADEMRAKLEQLGYRMQPISDRGGARPLHPTGEAGTKGAISGRSS